MLRSACCLAACAILLLAGCGGGAPDLGPPEGWVAEGTERWWREGVDTSAAFRDLESFETMGVGMRPEGPVHRNVQRQFLPLYRNNPEVVDSLFGAVVVPMVDRDAPQEERDAFVRQVRRRLYERFQEPELLPEPSAPIAFPDSLRARGVSGEVRLQVYLDAEGVPLAIEKLAGVDPTLDAIVMRAYTQRRWRPAYLLGVGIPAWVRSEVTFNPPPQ